MISWEVSADPQTQFSGLSSNSDIRPSNPGGGASITVTNTGVTTISSMWSRSHTISQGISFGAGYGGNTLFVLGTTNSTIEATNSDGVTTGSSVTVKSTLNVTSTQTNRQYTYTYRATGTETTETTAYATTLVGSAKSTTFVSTGQAVLTTTAEGTEIGTQTCIATTTGADTIATPERATVYAAEANEIIWVANNTAATDLSALVAASFVATSTTRATVQPWYNLATAIQANTTETTEVVLPQISASFSYASSAGANYTRNEVDNTNELPHQTTAVNAVSKQTNAANLAFTIKPEETINVAKSTLTETLCAESSTTATAFLNGSSYRTSTTISQTYTRLAAPVTVESSTYSETFDVIAYANNDTDQEYTWTGTFFSTTSNSLTTSVEKQGVTTSLQTAAKSYERKQGMVDSAGSLALGYSLATNLGEAGSFALPLLLPVSREASSLSPATFTFGDESASATFSDLSATLSFTNGSSTTLTLQPFGSPLPSYSGPTAFASAADPASLGQSETLYVTMPRGVYSTQGGTFSTTGQTTSATRGQGTSSAAPLPISFFVGHPQTAYVAQLLWTVPRNSHPSSSILTAATAYSAA
jgi:hypothetical protein